MSGQLFVSLLLIVIGTSRMPEELPSNQVNRRQALRNVAGVAAGAAAIGSLASQAARGAAPARATKGRINQSIVFWCFNAAGEKWSLDKTCQVASGLGCKSVELVSPEDWKTLEKHGLVCAIAPNGMPGAPFMKGFNNPAYHEEGGPRLTPPRLPDFPV